jgi:hypothetical protein
MSAGSASGLGHRNLQETDETKRRCKTLKYKRQAEVPGNKPSNFTY